MPVAWFLCPYKRRNPGVQPPERYCAMDDFTAQIRADDGTWTESEGLGNYAVVKVRASVATLSAIAATPGIDRIPLSLIDDPVNTMTVAQQNVIQNRLLAMGYTAAELNAAFPLGFSGPYTLRQVLRFAVKRRLKPRYDPATDSIILDGAAQPTRPVEDVDGVVV